MFYVSHFVYISTVLFHINSNEDLEFMSEVENLIYVLQECETLKTNYNNYFNISIYFNVKL